MSFHRSCLAALTVALIAASAPAAAQSPEAKAAYSEGIRFAKVQNYDAALGAFKRALQLEPNYAAAWTESGNSHLKLKQLPAARQSFERALQLEPANLTARYNLAFTLRQMKAYDDAAAQYQRYLEARPQDADAHYGLAETFKAAGKWAAAAEAFEGYARTEKRTTPTWKKWIAKAKEEAAALRKKAAAEPPTAPKVTTAPTMVAKVEPVTEPARMTPPAVAPAPKDKKVHLSFSKSAPAAEAPAATNAPATTTPVAAPAPAPRRPKSFDAGLNELKAGRFEAALANLNIARAAAPDDTLVLAAVGSAHLGLYQGPQAAAAYQAALGKASDAAQPGLYLGLAEALRVQGDDAGALATYRKAEAHAAVTPVVKRICQERAAALAN